MAHQFEAAHPGVKFEITPLENEAFKTKLTTAIQAGNPPDIFHTWGGGVLAQQADAGMVKDLTGGRRGVEGHADPGRAATPYTIDGKTYGSAVDTGMVGFWYNKELFTRAGISAPPATWADFLEAVRKLKAAKHHPDRAGRQGEVAGPLLLGVPGDAGRPGWTRCSRRRPTRTSTTPTSSRPARTSRSSSTCSRSRRASSAAGYSTAGRSGRHDGQRQGRRWS